MMNEHGKSDRPMFRVGLKLRSGADRRAHFIL